MTRLAPPAMLYALLCAPLVVTPEAVSVLAVAVLGGTIAARGLRVPRGALGPVVPLLIVLVLGVFGATGHAAWDVVRDFWYLGKSVALFLAAYVVAWAVVDLRDVLRAFVASALAAASLHVVQFVANPAILGESIGDIRNEVGRGYLVTAIALAVLIASRRAGLPIEWLGSRARALIAALACASLALSFSRTFLTAAAILLVVAAGGLELLDPRRWTVGALRRGLVAALALSAVTFGAYRLATSTEIGSDFLDKFERSFDELTVADYGSRGDISQHWRGYETHRVWVHYLDGGLRQMAFGRGYGALVDTGLHMQLGEDLRRYVSALHNGYADLLLKTGAVGLSLYVLFFVGLIRRGLRASRAERSDERLAGELLVGACLVLIATTLVISGLMNKMSMNPAVLLIGSMLAGLDRTAAVERLALAQVERTPVPLRRAS